MDRISDVSNRIWDLSVTAHHFLCTARRGKTATASLRQNPPFQKVERSQATLATAKSVVTLGRNSYQPLVSVFVWAVLSVFYLWDIVVVSRIYFGWRWIRSAARLMGS